LGLDNIPQPYPCKSLARVKKLKISYKYKDGKRLINCSNTPCPFHELSHIIGILGTHCWLRGKVYNAVVEEYLGRSLYKKLSRRELEDILSGLKDVFLGGKVSCDGETFKLALELISYLETLLSIREWNGSLIPWY